MPSKTSTIVNGVIDRSNSKTPKRTKSLDAGGGGGGGGGDSSSSGSSSSDEDDDEDEEEEEEEEESEPDAEAAPPPGGYPWLPVDSAAPQGRPMWDPNQVPYMRSHEPPMP